MNTYKVLIVEDDSVIGNLMKKHLEKWEFQVHTVLNFKDILSEFQEVEPDIVLMDVMLPFHNGFYWCNEIRKISKLPIMFVSSAGDNMNIVMAMDMGGDDFVTKPFDLNVLTAKMNALLRRSYSFQGTLNILEHRGVRLNLSSAIASYGDKEIELTKNEYKILQILIENAGEMVSRDNMMLRLWNDDEFVDDNTLTVNIGRLRKKLAGIGVEDYVITKKGIGYMV